MRFFLTEEKKKEEKKSKTRSATACKQATPSIPNHSRHPMPNLYDMTPTLLLYLISLIENKSTRGGEGD